MRNYLPKHLVETTAKVMDAKSNSVKMSSSSLVEDGGAESEEHLHDSLDDQGVADSGVGSSSERTSTVRPKSNWFNMKNASSQINNLFHFRR